nr:hypothetical protein [uncultured Rhodoferax sp.]
MSVRPVFISCRPIRQLRLADLAYPSFLLMASDSLIASGKMIGIISYVKALKIRIPAQIRWKQAG